MPRVRVAQSFAHGGNFRVCCVTVKATVTRKPDVVKGDFSVTQQLAATNPRTFRTFLLMQQFAAAEIGARIAQARKEAGGMRQRELADLLDTSARSVQNYEAGVSIPWRHFKQLEVVFKRPMEWFLYGEEAATGADEEISLRLDRIERLLGVLAAQAGAGGLGSPSDSTEN